MTVESATKKDRFNLVEFGFFLILVGVIFAVTLNLPERILDFLRDLKPEEVYPNFFLPAPRSNHPVIYNAIFQFSSIFALFQVAILAARFLLKEPLERKFESASGLLFWLGLAAASNILKDGGIKWLAFIGCIIILIGVVIIVRSTANLCSRLLGRKTKT